jgi:putative ABC transport system substrate-binding protein
MRRRDLIAGLLLLPIDVPARAQAPPRISILHSGFPQRTPIDHLIEALQSLGCADGRTAKIEVLGGEADPKRLQSFVTRLAAERPEVIIALTSPAVRALKQAGVSSPVVFAFVTDPVGSGVVKSLSHPGGNYTGVTYSNAAIGGKRLGLLLEALPGIQRVAVMWSRAVEEFAAIVSSIRQAAEAARVEIISAEINGLQDLALAFDHIDQSAAQALIFLSDNVMFGHRKEVAALELEHRLPSIHSFSLEVVDGALMSYGPDVEENYRRAAALAARVLKGEHPGELPVEEPTRFSLYINLKTAKALNLTLPPTLLAQADEVVE